MSDHRQAWQTLSALLGRLESDLDGALPPAERLERLEQELRKLGKAQFKANALAEEQAGRLQGALAALQAEQVEQAARQQAQAAAAQAELLRALLPALDGLDTAIASGQSYLQRRDLAAHKVNLTPAQAILVSPPDRAVLAGWLDGLRLVRERLLAVLAAGEVIPIPTVGQPFDPYQHVAVGATSDPAGLPAPTPGLVAAEERRGYRSPGGVLRYAEVVVYKPDVEKSI